MCLQIRKLQIAGLTALFTFLFMVSSIRIPSVAYGQGNNDKAADRRLDVCDFDVRGEANGLQKKCQAGSSSGITRGDFNGDGFADLAIGTPNKNTPANTSDSGAVYVIYGSTNGLLPAGGNGIPATQFWSQNSSGIPDSSEAGDRFGAALASGNFNGDDFSDLAVGVPGEDHTGFENAGKVIVIYGSPNGLTATDPAVPAPNDFEMLGFADLIASAGINNQQDFGSALTWGDFDGDTIGDLAIGAPGVSIRRFDGVTRDRAGIAYILFGVEGAGLSEDRRMVLHQDMLAVQDTAATDDHFGAVLAAGDFDRDLRTDLVVGTPDDHNGGGVVHVFLAGLSEDGFATDARLFTLLDFGLAPQQNDRFGASFATGDFDADAKTDLAIGIPDRDGQSGLVCLLSSTNAIAGVLGTRSCFDQSGLFSGGRESGDRFGYALAAGDFNADGFADLAIGVPYEDLPNAFGTVRNGGEVDVIYGSSAGFAVDSAQQFRQGTGSVEGTLETDDLFGATLSAWNFGRNETIVFANPPRQVTFRMADLAIGVPLENLFNPDGSIIADAGAVNVLYGTRSSGLTATNDQMFVQSNIGSFTNVADDRFGRSLY
jgi:hypothetical protein